MAHRPESYIKASLCLGTQTYDHVIGMCNKANFVSFWENPDMILQRQNCYRGKCCGNNPENVLESMRVLLSSIITA